ncbi:mitochondrial resolvase Ydc2 [Podospora appendiculata]|uniref:Mitochondrial resolvase Ydc2 n=1 Tax=Podospora appendiculata TaxID=314037 RepID=A0AAE0X3H4_9PEZI|nr:mitochondrial resolvase Ydc2 [Podospora appendiculata]
MGKTGALNALKAANLQHMLVQCGLNKSGTKLDMYHRLRLAAKHYEPVPATARVLSIDMGIRNLAFSLLSPAAPSNPQSEQAGNRKKSKSGSLVKEPLLATIHKWRRLSLSPVEANAVEGDTKEDFSPGAMAQMAVTLVQDVLLPLRPTHVLIERQRFRTAGGSSILEWTVRVNTLEAMIYAIFTTLRSLKLWDGKLIPITPMRVGSYLVEGSVEEAAPVVEAKMVPKVMKLKQQKVSLLASWIEAETKLEFPLETQAKEMAHDFLGNWNKAVSRKNERLEKVKATAKPEAGEPRKGTKGANEATYAAIRKLDDLSDSLLQGVAWLQWQENIGGLIQTEAWITASPEPSEEIEKSSDETEKQPKLRKERARKSRTKQSDSLTPLKKGRGRPRRPTQVDIVTNEKIANLI